MLSINTVEPETLGLLKRLMNEPALRRFTLVGGTALALQIGHRRSIDLDLFSPDEFDDRELLETLIEKGYRPSVRTSARNTLILEIEGIKVDLIRFRYPFLHNTIEYEGIRMADVRDIACMKIDAIVGRGKKKDFCDLYFLLKRFTLPDMMIEYQRMFSHSTLFNVYKSLSWFEDAEMDGEPEVFDIKYSWAKTKKAILKAVEAAL